MQDQQNNRPIFTEADDTHNAIKTFGAAVVDLESNDTAQPITPLTPVDVIGILKNDTEGDPALIRSFVVFTSP